MSMTEIHEIHYFDLDDVIVFHDNSKIKIHVRDENNEIISTFSPGDWLKGKYFAGHGQHYDFSEFKSADIFKESASPIHDIISLMNGLHNTGHIVEILTARSDFDNQADFAQHMLDFGIDINKIHVRRSGNLNMNSPPLAKKMVIEDYIKTNSGVLGVHLYDDSEANLDAMMTLADEYPNVKFYAHHVTYNRYFKKTNITTKTS